MYEFGLALSCGVDVNKNSRKDLCTMLTVKMCGMIVFEFIIRGELK